MTGPRDVTPDERLPMLSGLTTAYDWYIEIEPVQSAHGEGWQEAECLGCSWTTSGTEAVCEEAGYEHVAQMHSTFVDYLERRIQLAGRVLLHDTAAVRPVVAVEQLTDLIFNAAKEVGGFTYVTGKGARHLAEVVHAAITDKEH